VDKQNWIIHKLQNRAIAENQGQMDLYYLKRCW